MQQINIRNLSYVLDSGEALFSGVSFTVHRGDKVGVIGSNGSGKTTLLKILTGELKPNEGQLEVPKSIYTVPQQKDSGDVELKNLSGGEFIRYHLNKVMKMVPDVLLLDEPTNHLDEAGRILLQELINNYKGILVFVSHDVDFLKQNAKTILHFWDKGVEVFGGGYGQWKENFAEYLDGIARKKSALKKEERKLKAAKIHENDRFLKANKRGRKLLLDGSQPAFLMNAKKLHAQGSHGKKKSQLERLEKINKDNQLECELPKDLDVSFIFPETEGKKSLLIKVENGNLKIGERVLLNDYNFEIYYGDKILLKGDNGSGKSLLINSLIKKEVVAEKSFFKSDLKVACLDQFYNIVNSEQTILENVLGGAANIEIARKVLSLYGFPDTYIVNQKATHLSGGEMCRLALAKISVTPLDLIVLDEPTNNIDMETKEVLLNSLKKFKGAVLLISHDKEFVGQMDINKKYQIKDSNLVVVL
jgi:ATPase subunit of ABC transporter with duplicated ATPase domains